MQQSIAGRAVGEPDRPIVAAVGGIFAPRVRWADPPHRQARTGTQAAVRPPPDSQRTERTARGCAIAFDFVRLDAGASERHLHTEGSGREPPPAPVSGPYHRPDVRKGRSTSAGFLCEH